MKLHVLLIFLLLCACSKPTPVVIEPVKVERDLTPVEKLILMSTKHPDNTRFVEPPRITYRTKRFKEDIYGKMVPDCVVFKGKVETPNKQGNILIGEYRVMFSYSNDRQLSITVDIFGERVAYEPHPYSIAVMKELRGK